MHCLNLSQVTSVLKESLEVLKTEEEHIDQSSSG
jgi:hypothetical protein